VARLADVHERIGSVEERVRKLREQIQSIHAQLVDEDAAMQALSLFDPVWERLTPKEQARVIALLVEGVDFDGAAGKVSIRFHPSGIKTLSQGLSSQADHAPDSR